MSIYDTVVKLVFNAGVQEFYDHVDDMHSLIDVNIFNDLAYDSLDFVQLVLELERVFNIEIPDEYLLMEYLSTVGKICCIVNELLPQK